MRGSDGHATLADHWPEVAEQLHRDLSRFRMSADDRDEIVQEVAARALAQPEPPDDLIAWSRVVGKNLAIAWYRQQPRRLNEVPLAPELLASPVDVARLAEQRMVLRAVDAVWGSLSEKDREAMAAELGGPRPMNRRETVAWSERRRHVRARLRDMVGGVPAALGGLWRTVYGRLARILSAFDPRMLDHAVVAALSSAAVTLTFTAAVGLVTAPADDEAPVVRTVGFVESSASATEEGVAVGASTPVARPASAMEPAGGDRQVAPGIRRQSYSNGGSGERLQVESPPPAEVETPVPGANNTVAAPPVWLECPDGERPVYLAVACPLIEGDQ